MMQLKEWIQSVERMRPDLLRQAYHYLGDAEMAEDAVQDTLLKLWIAKHRIANVAKMKNFAAVICKNTALDMLRHKKRMVGMEEAITDASSPSPQVLMEERESFSRLEQGIRSLPPKQRAILRMRNVEHLPYADIAKILGTTESSVRGMMSKARLNLINQLKGGKL